MYSSVTVLALSPKKPLNGPPPRSPSKEPNPLPIFAKPPVVPPAIEDMPGIPKFAIPPATVLPKLPKVPPIPGILEAKPPKPP